MDVLNSEQVPEKDCTPKCHSRQHAALLLSCMSKGSPSEIRSYCNWLCYNFGTVTDAFGRNLLHLAASSGKWQVIQWLIDHCHCNVDVRDAESGWTALHRSFFYGQITAARALLNRGANLHMTDHDGMTPLDLLIEDRLPYIEYNMTYPQDVYVWGSNSNFNLGVGNEQSRAYPEILDAFRKENASIKQVVMCKFHTVFLSTDGRLLTCGHGHGGRLGQGSEVTGLSPSPVNGLGAAACQQVAAGQDHLILLMDDGQVWSCGLNMYHQLGHSPPPERLVKPKPLNLKFLKGKEVLGVCAARFHSVFYTKDSLFTFGLNAGQLGHPKGARTQILPHQVSGIYNKDWEITHVAVSDGATVCATNRGDVYVLHEFQHRKIASRQLEIKKLSVIGGHLDSSCDAADVREGGGLELRVVLLTQSGKLYLWRQSNPYLRRCLFTSNRQLIISDVHLNHYTVAMVTLNNLAYLGTIAPFKERKGSSAPAGAKPQRVGGQLNVLLDREDCDFIRAKRLPHIYRATSITSDSKGRNFAVLQTSPKVGLLELPTVSESKIQENFQRLLAEASIADNIHDVVIKVGSKEYAAHKYILASRSEYFKKQLMNLDTAPSGKTQLTLENVVPEAFEQILQFLYCNTCDFLVEGREVKWIRENASTNGHIQIDGRYNKEQMQKSALKKKGKTKVKNELADPLTCMQQACKRLNIQSLSKVLQHVQLINSKVHIVCNVGLPDLKFDCKKLPSFCDVCILSEEGSKFPCHKCVLIARSDYFHSMLSSSHWIEKTRLESLTLSIPSKILDVLLHYLYSDANYIYEFEDPEFLCQLLMFADLLLMGHLKEMCEMALVCFLTLKNAPDLLHFASIYNAVQLKRACMEFICINLPSIIEAKNLDVISNDVMEELSQMYCSLIPSMRRRVITQNPNSPFREELQTIEKCFPVNQDLDVLRSKVDPISLKSNDVKTKSKRRTKSQNYELKETDEKKQRCDSESSEKDIMLDVVALEELKSTQNHVTMKPCSKVNSCVSSKSPEDHVTHRKPGQWTLNCPKLDNMPSLDKIMEEEQRKMTILQRSANFRSETKRLPHLSQKQKKLLAAGTVDSTFEGSVTSNLPLCNKESRSLSICPWGKVNEFTPSVCNVSGKGELHSLHDERQDIPSSVSLAATNSLKRSQALAEPSLISLEAIQKAEQEELNQAMKPKVKSLHLINIEDQAIEELLVLYKASDNPNEKITVSRVLPERIAKPIWKKQATVPFLN